MIGEDPGVPQETAPASGADLRRQLLDYWRVLVQRRWVVVSCLGIVLAGAAFSTFFATPQYQATVTLQVEREAPDILNFKNIVGVDPSWEAYGDFYQTQYKILQSRSVLRIAAERLDLLNRPDYVGRKAKPISRLIGWARSLLQPATETPSDEPPDPLMPAVYFLAKRIDVRPIRNSHLVQISITDSSPTLAKDAANAVVEAYLQFTYESVYGTTAIAREFLTKEVARVQQEISDLERKLQDYGAKKELLSVDANTEDISQQALQALNARYIEARSRLAVAEARWGTVRSAEPASLPEVLTSPLIAKLKEQYAESERRRSQMSERFQPGWPALRQLEQEIAQSSERLEIETRSIANQVRQVARSDFERAKAEVDDLDEQVKRQKNEVQRVNRDAIEYASLKAEIETKRQVLTGLASRQSETVSSERLQDTGASNVRVVDPAELPKNPVRPRKAFNLLLGLVLGLGLGVASAFVLDHLDNSIKSEQDIQRIAQVSVLGYVPRYRTLKVVDGPAPSSDPSAGDVDVASHSDPRSSFAEAFKNLRTSLLLASPERPPRHIVVTSCEPQDGKSTISNNLAIVLTQLGKKVLLIDADLRRPRLHRSFGLSNDAGLSSVLSGNAEPEMVLTDTEIPGLTVVSSGPVPPNPSELLGSPSLASFLKAIDEDHGFDHVILDSPPVGSVTDPVLLSASADVTIVVVRAGKTTRDFLLHSVEKLRKARTRIAGAVLNDVTDDAGGYYYYGRYRYYRHYEADAEGNAAAPPRRRRLRRHGRRTGTA